MCQHKLLLVDDSPSILKALQRAFKSEGYSIFAAGSAQEAMRVLAIEDIDVLITDENMPGVSGTEMLKTVRDTYPNVIRIMLTGMTDIEVAKRAINSGEIYRFFTKPWDDFELLTSVRYALKLKALEQENTQLKSAVGRQEDLLKQLEREFPGIAERKIAPDGSIIIDE